MKIVSNVLLAALAAAIAACASQAAEPDGNKICLEASAVSGTTVLDDRTILFRMRDGRVWKNTLRRECPQLKFWGGFDEVIRGDEICANQQIIRVLQTKLPCQLGAFSAYQPPAKDTAN
ncbi:MAG: hypothetical protein WDM91_11800 [Rhizomicrobium sp.]